MHQIEQTTAVADVRLAPETLDEIGQFMRAAAPVGGPSPEDPEDMEVRM